MYASRFNGIIICFPDGTYYYFITVLLVTQLNKSINLKKNTREITMMIKEGSSTIVIKFTILSTHI